ncbi:transcriptional regulator domain-containing protein [Hyphococcus sp.]|uniref:transcriptional regulator domain-containing protein n=1 Tax=Hyphococcus sp. TaxID=2038636 RepID=UPI0035C713B7
MAAHGMADAFEARNRLGDYDYVRLLTRSRMAWEYLRRNPDYIRDWRLSAPGRPVPIRLVNGATLLRLRRHFRRAQSWGLCSFRRSGCKRP